MILFLWKISQGQVSGYDVQFTSQLSQRGRTALPNAVVMSSPAQVRKARENFFGVKGAKIFNLLPVELRNINSDNADTFKKNLDTFPADVPDQPTDAELGGPAETNSLLHQLPILMLNT